jgi:hypothetical protein
MHRSSRNKVRVLGDEREWDIRQSRKQKSPQVVKNESLPRP